MSTETPAPAHPETIGLPDCAGGVLLALARTAIAARLGTEWVADDEHEWLRCAGASFITLMRADQLRGCIGTLKAHRSLGEDVKANAVAAAFNDPRFRPLTLSEFENVSVEVSVLSPLESVAFRDEGDAVAQLRPQIDGVTFEYGHHRSTFLPQVWKDFGDPSLFLGHLKHKAGLPPNFWDPTVKLCRYTVNKWRETK